MSKNKVSNRDWIWWLLLGIMIVIALIMFILYFSAFSNELSSKSSDWGAFGSYFSGIASLITFAGVLLTLKINSSQMRETIELNTIDNERGYLFQMLDLHRSKFRDVEFVENHTKGVEAFKEYTERANLYLEHIIFYKCIIEQTEKGLSFSDIDKRYCRSGYITEIISTIKNNISRLLDEHSVSWNDTTVITKLEIVLADNKVPMKSFKLFFFLISEVQSP